MVECAKNMISMRTRNAEHEKGDDFPAGQAGEIVAKEKKRETNGGNIPGKLAPGILNSR